jgi:hypothetical protein
VPYITSVSDILARRRNNVKHGLPSSIIRQICHIRKEFIRRDYVMSLCQFDVLTYGVRSSKASNIFSILDYLLLIY